MTTHKLDCDNCPRNWTPFCAQKITIELIYTGQIYTAVWVAVYITAFIQTKVSK